jgi:hypothetical protein
MQCVPSSRKTYPCQYSCQTLPSDICYTKCGVVSSSRVCYDVLTERNCDSFKGLPCLHPESHTVHYDGFLRNHPTGRDKARQSWTRESSSTAMQLNFKCILSRSEQIPVARSLWRLNLVRWHLTSVSPHYAS